MWILEAVAGNADDDVSSCITNGMPDTTDKQQTIPLIHLYWKATSLSSFLPVVIVRADALRPDSGMPVYTVYHRTSLLAREKEDLAIELTTLHKDVTGCGWDAVKVMFISFDNDSFFSGGDRTQDYVRIVGQIRVGRSEEQKHALLHGMYKAVCDTLEERASESEIQTQIIEIDDRLTVMTNGKLNE